MAGGRCHRRKHGHRLGGHAGQRRNVGKSHVAVFQLKKPLKLEAGQRLAFTLDQQYPDGKHLLGKFRISVTNSPPPLMLDGPPQNITAIVAVAPESRTADQQSELAKYFRSLDGQLASLQAALAEGEKLQVDERLSGAGPCLGTAQQPCILVQSMTIRRSGCSIDQTSPE